MAEEGWSDTDLTPLDEDDLSDTIKELTDVAAKWKNIGIFLGIQENQLEGIQQQTNNPLDCLRQMLVLWLRRTYNIIRFGEPTWVKLVETISHPAGGGNPSLAMKIARNHKDQSGQHGIDFTKKEAQNDTADKERQVREPQNVLADREKVIGELQDVIAVRERQIRELQDITALRERQIRELQDMMVVRERQIRELQDVMAIRERQIRELQDVMASSK